MESKLLKIHPDDDMVVALQPLKAGDLVQVGNKEIIIKEDIPAKHKFLETNYPAGQHLKMYGVVVGALTTDLQAGALLTTENIVHATEGLHKIDQKYEWKSPSSDAFAETTFQGYHREDGSVGTRNFWLVIPLVFCENRNLEILKNALIDELGYGKTDKYRAFAHQVNQNFQQGQADVEELSISSLSIEEFHNKRVFPNVDGIKFLSHNMGCGGTREDTQTLLGLLAGYITHSNVAGATILSLGCQHAQVELLKEEIHKRRPNFQKPLQVFEQQQYPSEEKLLETAIKEIYKGLAQANTIERHKAPLSQLIVGLECGASDGFSGISANPTVGQASDYLLALGGTTILSEFPELAGVENNLMQRASSPEVAERFKSLMEVYNQRAKEAGSGFEANPSPGNIRDGLITDAIKSAGAAKKGGTAPVADVLDYPEKANKAGLNLLCTPGNDVESTTALTGAGANLIFFTTGLGTPTGNPVCPVIKISTNSELKQRIQDIIDFDAGSIIRGEVSLEELGEALLKFAAEVASGKQTKAEQLGQNDFIPWKRGVSL